MRWLRMNKAPAFPLYASDFLTDTISWDISEVGVYFRLLCAEWLNRELPNDQVELARIAGCSPKRFQKVWSKINFKFQENDTGGLVNNKLEKIRTEQIKHRESRSKAGKQGAKVKWQN